MGQRLGLRSEGGNEMCGVEGGGWMILGVGEEIDFSAYEREEEGSRMQREAEFPGVPRQRPVSPFLFVRSSRGTATLPRAVVPFLFVLSPED